MGRSGPRGPKLRHLGPKVRVGNKWFKLGPCWPKLTPSRLNVAAMSDGNDALDNFGPIWNMCHTPQYCALFEEINDISKTYVEP